MAQIGTILGVKEVLLNIDRKRRELAAGTERGLKLAGLQLQRESQKLVPVEFGPLKASAFTRAKGSGFFTVVNVGYTADYALFVHERVEMKWKGLPRLPNPPHKGHYWDPQGRGQAKFLEEPARRLIPEMRATLLKHIKII